MATGWHSPEARAKAGRTRLENRAKQMGTTVERLLAPPLPRATRRATLEKLFWDGLTPQEVVALYPRENSSVLFGCHARVRVKRHDQLADLI